MLSSRWLPIATTARANWEAPIWWSTASSVASPTTVWVSASAWACTRRDWVSTARTSQPWFISSRDRELPKRFSPMMRMLLSVFLLMRWNTDQPFEWGSRGQPMIGRASANS